MTQKLQYTKADEDRLRAEATACGEPIEGALVQTPQPADIRYEDEEADKVTRVQVRVERADGSVKEYEAREPVDWEMNDPQSLSSQVFRRTGLGSVSGSGFTGLMAGMPSLRLSFTANPRHNLHIRNVRMDDRSSLKA